MKESIEMVGIKLPIYFVEEGNRTAMISPICDAETEGFGHTKKHDMKYIGLIVQMSLLTEILKILNKKREIEKRQGMMTGATDVGMNTSRNERLMRK